jgi:hypothetical protein
VCAGRLRSIIHDLNFVGVDGTSTANMAERNPQRIVRRMEIGRPAAIDDQLWPINVALLLLAAFVEGVIIARLDFVDPRPLYNAWTWTATLLATVGIGVWLVQRLDNHHVRRSVQLATVLSLLFHAVLVVLLNKDLMVVLFDEPPPPEAAIEEPREISIPIVAPDAPQQDFEAPVETQTPDAVEETPTRIEPPVEPQPMTDATPPAPVSEEAVAPNIPQINRPDETVPRRSETPGQYSRNLTPSPETPRSQASAPRTASQARPNEIAPSNSPSRRETAGPQTSRPAAEAPTTAESRRPDLPSRTPQRTDDLAQSSSSPTLPRRVAEPTQTPTTAARPSDVAGTPRSTAPNLPDPRITSDRPAASLPRVDRSAQAPAMTPNDPVRAPDGQRQPRNDNIAVTAPNAASNPASRARATPNPSATANAESPRARNNAAANAPSLEPRAQANERSTASTPNSSGPSGAAANSTAAVAPNPSANQGSRNERALDPGAANALAQSSDNRRANIAPREASEFSSPAQADRPRSSQSAEQGPRPSISPGNVAEQRSTGGIAGQGRSQNLDVGPGALQHPGQVASDSAIRPSATQNTEAGSALSPSNRALVGKRRADASLPSSTLRAQEAPHATAGGVAAPSLTDADSSLASDRASANTPRGATSADRGSATVDVGPRQVVGEGGSGRPSGGGQPNVGDIARSNTPTRRTPGGDQPSLLDAANPSIVAEAPRNSGNPNVSAGTNEPQPGALADARTESSPNGVTGGGSNTGAPGGAIADAAASGSPASSGRPSGAGEEQLVAAPGVVREGRRAAASGVPDIGPAVAPQLAGGPSTSDGSPGNPNSSGVPDGTPLDQQGPGDTRSTAGIPGHSSVGPSGATAGPPVANVVDSGQPGDLSGRRDPLGGLDPGEALANAGGGSRRRSATTDLPSGIGAAEAPAMASGDGSATGEPGELQSGPLADEPSRRSGGPESLVQADIGPGGLGALPTPDAGSADRRARIDVPDIAHQSTRQARRQSSTLPSVDGQVRMATDTYRFRRARRYKDAEANGAGRPLARTEEAVEAGLEFLTRAQSPDGSWSLHDYRGKPPAERCRIQSNTAATGLALLTYLGAGYDHYDDKYKEVVRGGLEWLVNHQEENGDLYLAQDSFSNQSARLYSHAIASIALCEAYGMTGDERLKGPAQKSIDFIIQAQHRQHGGWRYSAVPNADGYDSDTSVSGWMLMALRSAELAKLKVPRETFERVEGWLDRAAAPGSRGARYVYDPKAQGADKQHGRLESPQMTSIGLLMRMYLGWDRTKPEMVRGADYLAQTLPKSIESPSTEWQGAYYWYYATQVMFHMRGEHWQKWNERLHPLLTQSQRTEGPLSGSWDPDGPASDMWAQFGGRIYVTTLNLLSLEVYYRHLPIYEDTGR